MLLTCALERLPFVLGLSGHLQIAPSDYKYLHTALVERFKTYESLLGPRIEPFIATGLARGADQLGARAALDAGWGLVAILPMPAHEFLATEDFVTHLDAAREFSELLELSKKRIITLDAPKLTILDEGIKSRNDQLFKNQSRFLVMHCSSVIALWDGFAASTGACGTSFVVKLCNVKELTPQFLCAGKVTKHLDIIRVRRTDVDPAVVNISKKLPFEIETFIAEIRDLADKKNCYINPKLLGDVFSFL